MMVLIETVTLNLHKVLFVPKIRKNLLSVQAMTQMQTEVTFDEEKCYIIKKINIGHSTRFCKRHNGMVS